MTVDRVVRSIVIFALPLLVPLILQSANGFGETWLLWRHRRPTNSRRFRTPPGYRIGLVFGYSATNVFWKEIAAAHERADLEGMRRIYINSTRVLFTTATLIAKFVCFGPRL